MNPTTSADSGTLHQKTASSYWRPEGLLPLAFTAAAMELIYVLILRLNNLKEHVEAFIPLVLLQGILYFVSIWFGEKIRPRRWHLVFIFATAALFRITLFPLYPSLSDDLVRYRWDGKAQQAGYNPYLVHPGDPQVSALRDETFPAVVGPQYPPLYGPITEELLFVAYALFQKVAWMKLPFVALDLGVVLVLFRLLPKLGLSAVRAIVYAWSPLAIVEIAASGHNDSLAVFFFSLSLLFFSADRPRLSIGALALSALSKVWAGFLFPVFLFRTSWRLILIPFLLAAAAFAPYRGAGRALFSVLSSYGKNWQNNESLYVLIRRAGISDAAGSKVYLAIVGVVILYCIVRKLSPERSAFLCIGAILLFSPNVFSWYFTWILPLLAIYMNPAWLLLTITTVLSYHVLIPYRSLGLWQEKSFFVFLEYAPFFGFAVVEFVLKGIRKSRRAAATESGP